jgi:DNA-binding NarL/FixJ family response regulator
MGHRRHELESSTAPKKGALFTPSEWHALAESLRLTPQQEKVVAMLLEGKRDKQIATSLGMSLPTVRTHLSRTFARLNVSERVELLLCIFREFRIVADSNQAIKNDVIRNDD